MEESGQDYSSCFSATYNAQEDVYLGESHTYAYLDTADSENERVFDAWRFTPKLTSMEEDPVKGISGMLKEVAPGSSGRTSPNFPRKYNLYYSHRDN